MFDLNKINFLTTVTKQEAKIKKIFYTISKRKWNISPKKSDKLNRGCYLTNRNIVGAVGPIETVFTVHYTGDQ